MEQLKLTDGVDAKWTIHPLESPFGAEGCHAVISI